MGTYTFWAKIALSSLKKSKFLKHQKERIDEAVKKRKNTKPVLGKDEIDRILNNK